MARPRKPIGTFGEIYFEKTHDGRARALTRFRDYDGQLGRVQATADSPKAAERKLKEVLAERNEQNVVQGELTAASSFRHLVDVWLADLDLEDALAPSTRALYERNMRQLVLPAFEHDALREISVRKVDQFIKTLAKTKSYSMAKQARTVLSLAFALYVAVAEDLGQRRPDGQDACAARAGAVLDRVARRRRRRPFVTVDVQVETTIARPPAEVAAYAGDPTNAPEWYVNIKSVRWETAPPVAVGSRMDFVARFVGRRIAYTYEVAELVPGEPLVMRTADGPFPMETTYTWEPVEGGTRMRLRNRGDPSGFGRLTAPLMERAIRRAMTKDLARLKAMLER